MASDFFRSPEKFHPPTNKKTLSDGNIRGKIKFFLAHSEYSREFFITRRRQIDDLCEEFHLIRKKCSHLASEQENFAVNG